MQVIIITGTFVTLHLINIELQYTQIKFGILFRKIIKATHAVEISNNFKNS